MPSGVMAMAMGPRPTVIFLPTWFVAVSKGATLPEWHWKKSLQTAT